MKTILLILALTVQSILSLAQSNKEPVIVEHSPTLFNTIYDPYFDYADQGSRMYINNSQFYNKDNIITGSFPASNGQYMKPGNSNPINKNMNEGAPLPSGTIYSGYLPVRDYGEARDGVIR